MKPIYISPQRLMWVYRKTDFMISSIFCYILLYYVKDHFPKMLWSSAFFPISLPFPLIFVILYDYIWKTFFMLKIDIFVNLLLNLQKRCFMFEWKHFWLVLFLLSQYIGSGSSTDIIHGETWWAKTT